jgi:hypothetical protein
LEACRSAKQFAAIVSSAIAGLTSSEMVGLTTTEIAAFTSAQIPALEPTALAAAVQAGFSSAAFTGTEISFMTQAEQNLAGQVNAPPLGCALIACPTDIRASCLRGGSIPPTEAGAISAAKTRQCFVRPAERPRR